MIPVAIFGNGIDADEICDLGMELQSYYQFGSGKRGGAASVECNRFEGDWLFRAGRSEGVQISTLQSDGIAYYAGIGLPSYYLLFAALGLTQWRALELNPTLIEEDLQQSYPLDCLFSQQAYPQDYALLLEDPKISSSSWNFYRCLGLEPELSALEAVLHHVQTTRTDAHVLETPIF